MKCKKAIPILFLCIILISPTSGITASAVDVVRANVLAWAQAWESRDIDRYMDFYSPAFHSKGMDFNEWKAKKAYVFQKNDAIQIKIIDLWVMMEGDRVSATFLQHYKDRSGTDIGEKTLVMIRSNDSWKIVSETWKPMSVPLREGLDAKAAESPVEYKADDEGRRPDSSEHEQKDSPEGKTIVNNVHFKIKEPWEQVCIGLNKHILPKILKLEGENPRIVLDIMNVSDWKGEHKIPVKGRLVRQIRTYLHRKEETLRIVLDLNSAKDYVINQTFINSDRMYCIEIR